MDFVINLNEIIENILTLEKYLRSKDGIERKFAEDLVRKGKTILVYKVNGEFHFAPSRFSGYRRNNINTHFNNTEKDGKETNPIISRILVDPLPDQDIDDIFIDYCAKLGVKADNNKWKYWHLKTDEEYLNLEL